MTASVHSSGPVARSSTGRPGGVSRAAAALRRLVAAAMLAILAWQSVVTQSHVHRLHASRGMVAHAGAAGPRSHPDDPADCPICREVAQAAQYLSPTPVAVGAPTPVLAWRPADARSPEAATHRSPGWRSRAPPALLAA